MSFETIQIYMNCMPLYISTMTHTHTEHGMKWTQWCKGILLMMYVLERPWQLEIYSDWMLSYQYTSSPNCQEPTVPDTGKRRILSGWCKYLVHRLLSYPDIHQYLEIQKDIKKEEETTLATIAQLCLPTSYLLTKFWPKYMHFTVGGVAGYTKP